ncbi:glutathione S-transferase family protein [Sphingosinicella rhizophila]|uniref:Glutathione S-transferase family protein n=1 Tax=Sphingosinicella rhizophila TaxID=3050082 RepID=A0ABU3Q9K1_9SPHN|nr:glutathione S-transferase family protein [Sphingosinicella sp. GR2756]MDT9600069.1 glutathione S-transferase family protein [Sphingosinicella sp. GR2756]
MILHYHPLSSCCWKVLIALYEKDTPFEARMVDFGDEEGRRRFLALWPTGKIPLLQDGDRIVPETSVMIDYLDRRDPGRIRLLPQDAEAQLEVRLLDRLFDLYVMTPMQQIVAQALRPEEERDPRATAEAHKVLAMAYAMIDARIGDRAWAAGAAFSLADCAAAPSLFYANILLPFGEEHRRLAAYARALMARPSVRRVIDEARPYFRFFPLQDLLPAEYKDEA